MCKRKTIGFLLLTLLFGSGNFFTMKKDVFGQSNITAFGLPAPCDVDGFKDWFKVGRNCVKYFKDPANFTMAEFSCRTKVPGGHLVSVHSSIENRNLLAIVQKFNAKYPRFWLGAFALFKSGRFLWVDGSYWNFEKWTNGEPNHIYTSAEQCVEMNWKGLGKWNDDICSIKKSYMCGFKRKYKEEE